MAWLNTDTQMHVRMFQPKSVFECLLLGRLYETAHPRKNSATTWSNRKAANKNNNYVKGLISYQKPVEQVKSNVLEEDKKKEWFKQPQKFLSNEDMSERRTKGLCYCCDEKYTPGH